MYARRRRRWNGGNGPASIVGLRSRKRRNHRTEGEIMLQLADRIIRRPRGAS
jgi:hypothetical protein